MALEQKLSLKLAQRLVMTPSLQQAIKLLQMTRMELQTVVTEELVENPVLEEGDETFELTITNASSNAHITIASGTGTIIDDEEPTAAYTEDFTQQISTLGWSVNYEDQRSDRGLWHIADSLCFDSISGPAALFNRLMTSDFRGSPHGVVVDTGRGPVSCNSPCRLWIG